MQLGFDTDELKYAKAALLLYAMYKSREDNSSLQGLDTWSRCESYIKGAVFKSTSTPEFIQVFCEKAKINSIRPLWLKDSGIVRIAAEEYVELDKTYDYRLNIIEDNEILDVFAYNSLYIIMLLRERLQRERMVDDENTL